MNTRMDQLQPSSLAALARMDERRERERCVRAQAEADRSWHVVYIGAKNERLAKEHLERAGLQHRSPMMRTSEPVPLRFLSKAERKNKLARFRTVTAPIFPRYHFVLMSYRNDPWRDVFELAGVQGMSFAGGCPAALSVGDMEKLQAAEVAGAIPGETPVRELLFALGDQVQIVDGAFASFTGSVEQLDESGRLQLLVDIFGRSTPLSLDVDQVRKA